MFMIRPYREEDAGGCGQCFYEGFFTCPIDENDRILLRDYAQILIEKCSFTYVAETLDHQIAGFISGNYGKKFRPLKTDSDRCKKHYMAWCRMFLKFYLKGSCLSEAFQKQLDSFILQAREREEQFLTDVIWSWWLLLPEQITGKDWERCWYPDLWTERGMTGLKLCGC